MDAPVESAPVKLAHVESAPVPELIEVEASQFPVLLVAAGISALMLVAVFIFSKRSRPKNKSYKGTYKCVDPKTAKNNHRAHGTWTPEKFVYPPVEEFKGFSLKDTPPVAYRAFKHTYFVTMGIRSMDWNSWIEIDNEWMAVHKRKLERIEERGTKVYGTSPDTWDGAIEYLMELREFLPARYPTMFEKTEKGLHNIVTDENFAFVDVAPEDFEMDPMLMVALMVEDDIAVLTENEDGEYVLKAGAVMLAGFWRLSDKLNLPLSAIHTTGNVPKYNEKLRKGMENFFLRVQPANPVVRNNYFIQTDDDVAWSTSIGNEDNKKVGWMTAPIATDINKIYYRSERQSVRRLPKTGAIAFTIRPYFIAITEMCKEPFVPRRLFDGIKSWSEDVREYRGYYKFKDVLLPYLEEKAKEQEAKGYTPDKDKSQFPF